MTTRVETILIKADFGAAVIAGLEGSTDVRWARKVWAELRESVGYRKASAALLTSGASQQKLSKNSLPSFGLMLTPERGMMAAGLADVRQAFGLSGGINLCPMASKGCAAACLSRSGQSGMPAQQRAQAVRTAFLLSHPVLAGLLIGAELRTALRRHGRINLRLNTTSDIRWELVSPDMVEALAAAGVLMYDYTAWSPADRKASADYSLTYSAKEPAHTSDEYLRGILLAGGTVAMPFDTPRGKDLPETWQGFRVIDGDKSDERRLDPQGVVVGLRAKGHEWKRDNTAGFIRASA
uniref:Gene product 88 domain-containing protein n=1 Tax=Mycobacterium phage BabyBack TaxID=3158877 RepID=A0AAU8GQT0_9CAUD